LVKILDSRVWDIFWRGGQLDAKTVSGGTGNFLGNGRARAKFMRGKKAALKKFISITFQPV